MDVRSSLRQWTEATQEVPVRIDESECAQAPRFVLRRGESRRAWLGQARCRERLQIVDVLDSDAAARKAAFEALARSAPGAVRLKKASTQSRSNSCATADRSGA